MNRVKNFVFFSFYLSALAKVHGNNNNHSIYRDKLQRLPQKMKARERMNTTLVTFIQIISLTFLLSGSFFSVYCLRYLLKHIVKNMNVMCSFAANMKMKYDEWLVFGERCRISSWSVFFLLSFLSYYAGTECAGSENLCSDVLVHMASLKWKSLAQSNEEATISVQDTHEVQSDWQQLHAKHSATTANRDKMQCR